MLERSPCTFDKVLLLSLRVSKREAEPLTGVLLRLAHEDARLTVAPLEISLKNLWGILCLKLVWQFPVY